MSRTAQIYVMITTIALFGIFGILRAGKGLHVPVEVNSSKPAITLTSNPANASAPGEANLYMRLTHNLVQNSASSLSRLFLQLFIIVVIAGVIGALFTRIDQPAVVGEMVAGIMLGPSLLGLLAPHVFSALFAPSTLEALRLFSQIGVCLFMFAVGMELDVSELRKQAQTAIVVSHSSIVVPYLMGVTLALFLYSSLAQAGASFTAFALFLGIGMSITAFPVLVRILKDRGIFDTPLGAMATACAAVDDITAWTILAFVVAIARAANLTGAIFSFTLVFVFVAVMLLAVRPLLAKALGKDALAAPEPSKAALATVLGVVLLSAYCTESIGIHALFGSFLAGVIMPRGSGFRGKLTVRIEKVSSVLLLPVFFVFTGLRTQIGLLNGWTDWAICLLIIAVATIGKLGGGGLAARLTGNDMRSSLQLGALMNSRGLMELIALNIGYDLGILSQRIFAMLVIMAIVTTMMTGPLLTLFRAKSTLAIGRGQQAFS